MAQSALEASNWDVEQATARLLDDSSHAPAPQRAAPQHSAPSGHLNREQREKVDNLVGMGFTEDQVMVALMENDWDMDRAVGNLMAEAA